MYLLLEMTSDKKHNIPICGKGKILEDMLARAKEPPFKIDEGACGHCHKTRCKICKHFLKP